MDAKNKLRRHYANLANVHWGNLILDEEEARIAAMSPAERANYNARIREARNKWERNLAAARNTTRRNTGRNTTRRNTGRNTTRRNKGRNAAWKPRPGKVMRECRSNPDGCVRHQTTGDCKFVHSDEPEFEHLRPDQRVA